MRLFLGKMSGRLFFNNCDLQSYYKSACYRLVFNSLNYHPNMSNHEIITTLKTFLNYNKL